MSKLLDKSSIVGVIVLVLGLLAGVFLIQQSQEFRERAGVEEEQMIVICHRVPNNGASWEEIEVSEDELGAYIDQGDLLGNCPDDFKRIDVKDNEVEEGNTQSDTNNDTAKLSVNLDSTAASDAREKLEEILIPTPTPTPEVEVVRNDATFRFFIKLQGVNAKRPARLINITFNKSNSETHTYKSIRISPNSEGVYFGQLGNIPSGIFDISFKTDSHLRETFDNIKIDPGINTWYFENSPLIAGDFNADNILDVTDIALLLAEMNSDSTNTNQDNAKYDVDVNARIDIKDLEIVLEGYNKISVSGE
jgi:hypothetical protein